MTTTAISDDDREDAALICAVAASTRHTFEGPEILLDLCRIADELEVSTPALYLAAQAIRNSQKRMGCWGAEVDAEAEALLRTGWTP